MSFYYNRYNHVMLVICDIMAHWYYTFVIWINICNAKKMNCAIMLNISNHYEIKYLCILLQLEPCNVILKVISDIMEHWYDMWNTIAILQLIYAMQRKWLCIDVYLNQSLCNKMA